MSPESLKYRKTRRQAMAVGLVVGVMASTAASTLARADSRLDWLPTLPQAPAGVHKPAKSAIQSPIQRPAARPGAEESVPTRQSWLISNLD